MDRLSSLSPRDRAIAFVALAGAVMLLLFLALYAIRGEGPGTGATRPDATLAPGAVASPRAPGAPGASPTADPSPVAIAFAAVVAAQAPPAVPPEVAVIAQPVAPAATKAPATPTPSPDPNVWRVEGVILDDATKLPIHEVCVVIGPHGCRRGSIRTDSRGVFFIDVPKNPTVFYDLYFVRDGYGTVWFRIRPEGPSVYNLALTLR